jgi:hypothetical protein
MSVHTLRCTIHRVSHTAQSDYQLLVQILLDAAVMYDQQCATQPDLQLPPLVIVITGKGPNKQTYREIMRVMTLPHVAICTAWVDASDYAALLACADLGVSLHVSSSGLDLPMKVSDMLGWCARHARDMLVINEHQPILISIFVNHLYYASAPDLLAELIQSFWCTAAFQCVLMSTQSPTSSVQKCPTRNEDTSSLLQMTWSGFGFVCLVAAMHLTAAFTRRLLQTGPRPGQHAWNEKPVCGRVLGRSSGRRSCLKS